MVSRVVVVSLGRIVVDQVRVDTTEAYAVLQQVWQRIRVTRDDDGALIGMPPLDAMGITAFGDFELREAGPGSERRVRPPHQLAQELGALLLRLLSSGNPGMEGVPTTCVEAARRALPISPRPAHFRPIVTPDALFTAIEAFRPRDPSAALAGLYARWRRTTDENKPAAHPLAITFATAAPVDRPASHRTRPSAAAVAESGTVKRRVMVPATPHTTRVVATPPQGRLSSTEPVSQRRGPRASRGAVAFVVLACLVFLGALAWQRMARQRHVVAVDRVVADADFAPPGVTDRPAAAPTPSTEVEIAPPATRSRAPLRPARGRRLLHAGKTGQPPYSPSFDPRTNAIVFHAGLERTALMQASLRSDGEVDSISTMREDGSRSYHAQVSPDGEHLVYDSDAEGSRGIYIANRDGSSPRRVSGPGHASVPTWSPDGQYVAFARAETNRPRVWNVWTVHVPTGTLRRLTSHRVGQAWGASWFPDGRQIAYSVEDRLVVYDLGSGRSRTYPTPVAGRLVRTPAVAPDGQRIVFQVRKSGAWVLDLETGTSDRLLSDASAQEFAWSPDGRLVAYQSAQGGEWGIWVVEMTMAP
jgi:hypothetical protein